ncbi:hypothetical protein B7495_01015 [Cryobacterium sp. LW097]|nr:hypothetical protein B7495_01015 [Cryobacterium sp. LW097]
MVPVSRAINTALTSAVVDVETACKETLDLPNTPAYQTPRVHLTRAATHHRLSKLGGIDGWSLSTQAGSNTPIHLYRDQNTLRLLHTPNATTVPAPGKNMARQFYYTNTALEGLAVPDAFYVQHNYLLLWRQGFATGEIALRLVRPIGVWKFGMPAKWDISMNLGGPDEDFSSFYFQPSEDEEEFRLPNELEAAEEEIDANVLS